MIGALAQGKSATGAMISEGSTALNMIIKRWQTKHKIKLWTLKWIALALNTASSQVDGDDGDIYTCIKPHIATADNRPVTGKDHSTFWQKRGDTGGAWVITTSYTAIGDIAADTDAIGIDRAFIRYDEVDYPVTLLTKNAYSDIPDKGDTGRPTHLWFQKGLDGANRMYLWPQPDLTTYTLHWFKARKLEDFDASGDNPDTPPRWIEALVYELAYKISHSYGIPLTERKTYKAEAKELRKDAFNTEQEAFDDDIVEGAY